MTLAIYTLALIGLFTVLAGLAFAGLVLHANWERHR